MTLPGPFGTPSRLTAAVLAAVAALAVIGLALLGAGLAQTGTGELRIPAAGTTALLRFLVLTGLAVHVGELAGRRLAGEGPRPRALSVPAALLASAASAGLLLLLAAVSGLSLPVVYGLREGRLLLVTANAFALAALCAASRRPVLAVVPLAVAVVAEALRAHTETYTPAVGIGLTVVHLTGASLWLGTLLYVLRTMKLRRGGRDVLLRYARMAAVVYAALAVTGTASTLRRLPLDAVLTTAYGRILLVKLLIFGGVSLLALAARSRMLSGGAAEAPARIEAAALMVVMVVSALLTVVPDPHWIAP
ncbi:MULTISPECIES: CopD family protein [Streptomyces]|uniref:Copper resistance protein CopD n=1 Tax=Streptomyces venezuelae TaxID=54571 RepID=A0A5P2ANA7_STRVZ|nr:CopD family protein [Streptomyces venezuelae]QES19703.1 copper resistance protein CopD [Streptomyces venezuelae]